MLRGFVAAISLTLIAGAALSADGAAPSGNPALPELGRDPAEKSAAALARERYRERPRYAGPRPYWENDPLFTAPRR